MLTSTLPDLREAADLLARRQPERAVAVLEDLTRQLPTYAAAQVLLARACEVAGDWDGALGAWQQAHFLLPTSQRVRTGLRSAMKAVYEMDMNGDSAPRPIKPLATAPEEPPAPTPSLRGAVRGRLDDLVPPAEAQPADDAQSLPPETHSPETPSGIGQPEGAMGDPTTTSVRAYRLGGGSDAEPEAANQPEAPAPSVPSFPLSWRPVSGAEAEPHARQPASAVPPPSVVSTTPTPLLPPADQDEPRRPISTPDFEQGEAELPDGWSTPPLEGFDALDDLIEALDGARITPRADLDELPTPELEQDIGEVVSPTLARIYVTQGQYNEAARIYDKLADQQPHRADEFRTRAAEARAQA